MSVPSLLNAAGRRRSPVTLPGYLAGRPPRNKGLRYPPDPPTVEEIVAVMRQAGDGAHGARMRAFIMLLWRAGLRINEALTGSPRPARRSRRRGLRTGRSRSARRS
jgi:integrase